MSIIVDDLLPRQQYTATGGQTVFAYNFPIFNLTDINVYRFHAGQTANDVNDILTYNVDYTVLNNVPPLVGGTITLNAPAALNDIITIVRNMPYVFNTIFKDGKPLPSASLNTGFDSGVMLTQQDKMYDRTIGVHYNNCDVVMPFTDTNLPVLPANCIWMKNNANTAIEAVAVPTGAFAILPTAANRIPVFNNANGIVQNSNFNAPLTAGIAGAPIITDGATPGNLSFSTTGGYLYQTVSINANINMVKNTAYVVTVAGVIVTLPTVFPFGSRITILNLDGLVTINQNAGQVITMGANSTTSGAGGSLAFGGTHDFEAITLFAVSANVGFIVESTTATDLVFT